MLPTMKYALMTIFDLRSTCEPLADLLDGEALAHRLERGVLRRFDADQQGEEPRLLHLAEDVGPIGDLQPGVDDVVLANSVGDQQVADFDDPLRLMREHVVDEQDQVGVDLPDLADNRRRRPGRPARFTPQGLSEKLQNLQLNGQPRDPAI